MYIKVNQSLSVKSERIRFNLYHFKYLIIIDVQNTISQKQDNINFTLIMIPRMYKAYK